MSNGKYLQNNKSKKKTNKTNGSQKKPASQSKNVKKDKNPESRDYLATKNINTQSNPMPAEIKQATSSTISSASIATQRFSTDTTVTSQENTPSDENRSHSYTANATPAPKIQTTPAVKQSEEQSVQKNNPAPMESNRSGRHRREGQNRTKRAQTKSNKLNLSNSVSKERQRQKIRESMTDWRREEKLRIKAAERDGLVSGLIVLAVMAMSVLVYAKMSEIFPIISMQSISDGLFESFLRFSIDLIEETQRHLMR